MIEIHNLSKRIGDKSVLQGISLTISRGESVAVIGANGAGKSTLLKILALLMKINMGWIRMNGQDIRHAEQELKRSIGYLPHQTLLYEHFSPLENLLYYGRLYQVEDVEKKAKCLIDEVGLSFFRNQPVSTFSRGMLQRVAIARAVIHSPAILLLDEPHTGLDQQGISFLNQLLLKKKKEGVTTIMVSHDLEQTAEICDRVVIMKNGSLADDLRVENRRADGIRERYAQRVQGIK